MTNSNFVGCSTGRSPSLAPLQNLVHLEELGAVGHSPQWLGPPISSRTNLMPPHICRRHQWSSLDCRPESHSDSLSCVDHLTLSGFGVLGVGAAYLGA